MTAANAPPSASFAPLFGASAEASMKWMDAQSQWVEIWLECQRSVWQPVLDWQVDCYLRWLQQAGLPAIDALAVRGREQLA